MDTNGRGLFAWLESSLKSVVDQDPVNMGIVATLPNGDSVTGYYNVGAQDMAIFAHVIYSDAVMEIVTNNIEKVKEALDEIEED